MSAREALERSIAAVDQREGTVHAWAYLDRERARFEADIVDKRPLGLLTGVILGAKDVFDTADQPTEFGSSLYVGNRPRADAAAVALLRNAGAVCVGKTATAEFACFHPAPTTNPHRETHTPGGSSMGSAAAVATGMADIAIGTQTAASIIRPASFCGVYGFKPSFGTVSVAGLKAVAPSLDTVGWFARDPELLGRVLTSLTGRMVAPALRCPPRLAFMRSDQWTHCSADSQLAVELMAANLRELGATVDLVDMPEYLLGLADQHHVIMAYEAVRALAFEYIAHRSELSEELCTLLDEGRGIDPVTYDAVRARIATARRRVAECFVGYNALLTPAVEGEAPFGLTWTGDPRYGRLWTMLGLPSVAIPSAIGHSGLPVGIQLIGAPGRDTELLAIAAWAQPER